MSVLTVVLGGAAEKNLVLIVECVGKAGSKARPFCFFRIKPALPVRLSPATILGMNLTRFFCTIVSAYLMAAGSVLAELPQLIPRDVLFGNPERTSPALSPDGKRLAWLAPDTNNVLQVLVKTVGKDDDKIITADKKRGIRQYLWAENNRTLIYLQDSDGDENFHVYGVDLESGNVRDYSPFQGVRAAVMDANPDFPDELLLTLNVRERALFDVYRLNLRNGALE